MRALYLGLLAILFIIYLMPVCLGCGVSYDRINKHQAHCKDYLKLIGGGLKRQAQDAEIERIAKNRKIEADRAAEAAAREAAEAERVRLAEEERMREEEARPVEVPTFSRVGRARRAPVWLRTGDMVPTSLAGLPEHIPRPPPLPPRPPPPTVEEVPDEEPVNPQAPEHMLPPPYIDTRPNSFGVFRRYTEVPQNDPEEGLTIDAFTDIDSHAQATASSGGPTPNPTRPFGSVHAVASAVSDYFAPFLNASVFRLMHWFYSGSGVKSAAELDRLVNDVLLAPDFKTEDLHGFSAKTELRRMDGDAEGESAFPAEDGWQAGTVRIALPKAKVKHQSEDAAPFLEVTNIPHRSFLGAIKAACEDITAQRFHFRPFTLFSQPSPPSPTSPSPSTPIPSSQGNEPSSLPPPERLYSEVYNSDAHIKLDEAVQDKAKNDREPGDSPTLEYATAPILIYSDSTHLANFGTASLWPIYFYMASLTKYIRGKPTAFAAHHLAYIPSLPDSISQAYEDQYGTPPTAAILRFCKKELMQKIWSMLLDDDFVEAYEHGFIVHCGDGVTRRIFPRILAYLADYPEKCLLACIKFLGKCPCPDCLVEKSRIHLMGTKADMATREKKPRDDTPWLRTTLARVRDWIFGRGLGPEGKAVESVLGNTATSPTQSAFSTRLAHLGFDIYRALVPDIMHEFELGVWKSTLTHLIRVLTAAGASTVIELNARYAQIPTFGRTTIRRFGANVSGLKKLAARDFEDLIQCAIPVFEGLLPAAHDRIVRRMLFQLAMWHALAKLRLHSESTLAVFEAVVHKLGQVMREFASKVCPEYDTQELDKEVEARQRQRAKQDSKGKTSVNVLRKTAERTRKEFNLTTYKFHRIGDGPRTVRLIGTLEGISTQTGETEHRRAKRFYAHTNKNAQFAFQIARHERRERTVHNASKLAPAVVKRADRRRRLLTKKHTSTLARGADEPLGVASPLEHTRISQEQRNPVNLLGFVHENEGDPAVETFIPDLRRHIFDRLRTGDTVVDDDYEPTREELAAVRIRHDRMYVHRRMQVNYTSYDMRREQDSINPNSQADIMTLAPHGQSHPYLYAHVIGIFHVNAYLADGGENEPTTLQVLWVRWYHLDGRADWGLDSASLPRLRFAPLEDEPFAFLSPDQVLRAVHLIPAFAHGQSDAALPGFSIARRADVEDDEDFKYYYVGIFADRDMFMRFLGGAVGHRGTAVDGSIPGIERLNDNTARDDPADDDLADDLNYEPANPQQGELPLAPPSDDDEDEEPLMPGEEEPANEELEYLSSSEEEDVLEPTAVGGDSGGEAEPDEMDEYEGFARP